jgi:hypothetical protein
MKDINVLAAAATGINSTEACVMRCSSSSSFVEMQRRLTRLAWLL